MLHTTKKWLEKCIDIKIERSLADHYTCIFNSRIFRLALEITFSLNKYFFLEMVYELLSQGRKLNKRMGPNKSEGLENFWRKIAWGDAY